ncbi:hypothetical protein CRENBAI_012102, partial [Crenichthys baileyi]
LSTIAVVGIGSICLDCSPEGNLNLIQLLADCIQLLNIAKSRSQKRLFLEEDGNAKSGKALSHMALTRKGSRGNWCQMSKG